MKECKGCATLLFVLGCCCLLASTALAERAPQSTNQLVEQSDLVVVGQITDLKIGTERSHIERGFGNYDWTIDLTIKTTAIEKGTLTPSDSVVARCFRPKSRKSMMEYVSVSGNHPIPGVGATVRAHLYRIDGLWRVVFPNGLASVSDQPSLSDAPAVGQLQSGRYTYLLPAEAWALVGVATAVLVVLFLIRKWIAGLRQHRKLPDTPKL